MAWETEPSLAVNSKTLPGLRTELSCTTATNLSVNLGLLSEHVHHEVVMPIASSPAIRRMQQAIDWNLMFRARSPEVDPLKQRHSERDRVNLNLSRSEDNLFRRNALSKAIILGS